MNLLEKIAAHKRAELVRAKKGVPLALLKRVAKPGKRSLLSALRKPRNSPAIIAEIKRISPSKGVLCSSVSGTERGRLYSKYADAISVVVDTRFFGGCSALLEATSRASSVPVLAKDFIIDEYQIYTLRKHGADAVLLIAALLGAARVGEASEASQVHAKHGLSLQPGETGYGQLRRFIAIAKRLGMDALVEVHTRKELDAALKVGARIIGINNRSLSTLKIDMNTTQRLSALIPRTKRKNIILVSESGFSERAEIDGISRYADATLVGTALMRAQNVQAKLKELAGKPLLKVCGVTSLRDARAAIAAGADLLGFNFYEGSPRFISAQKARRIIKKLPREVLKVGVFVNEEKGVVERTVKYCGLDSVQLHGDESPAYCSGMKLPVIKALRVSDVADLKQINKYKTGFILLDALVSGAYGGTGKALPKGVLRAVSKLRGKRKIFIAGGLNAANVNAVAGIAKPYGVDVCSGVEASAGVKSKRKLKAVSEALYGAHIA